MQPTFDPVRKRQFWLEFNLAFETRFTPDEIPAKGQPIYLSTMANSLIAAYLLGLVDRVEPTLQAMVAWMAGRPEPDTELFRAEWDHWRDGWYALYAWRRTLGLCKWLCGIEGGEIDLDRALDAEWQAWKQARPEDAARDFQLRRESLAEHLAMAIAANNVRAGLHLRTAAGIEQVSIDHSPLLFHGQWACLHLYAGYGRDEEFVAKGIRFVGPSLWPELLLRGRYTEAALWLKAIYWDSGIMRTAEETMARAYDFLPDLHRPSFVPA